MISAVEPDEPGTCEHWHVFLKTPTRHPHRPDFWVSDRYGGQMGWASVNNQVCLADLIRDVQYAIDSGDDEKGAVVMVEDPQPPVLLAHSQAGLVELQDRSAEEPRADRGGRRRERNP